MTAEVDLPQWAVATALALLAAAIGALAGVNPTLAMAAALGVALFLITLADLNAGLVAFVVLSFLELVPSAGGPAVSLAKVAGAVLAVSWIASAATSDRREFPAVHPGIAVLLLAFLAWNLVSILWAAQSPRVAVSVSSFALSFVLFLIVFAAVRNLKAARLLVGAFIVGATVAAVYGYFLQPDASGLASSASAAGGLDRLSGTIGDPNEFATLLVAGMALCTAFIFDPERSGTVRFLSGTAAVILLGGVLLTLSRGGLVALGAALIMAVVVAGKQRPKLMFGVTVVVALSLFFYLGVTSDEARERVTASDGGSGRTDIWNVGWRMVEDKPVVGVGAGNFQAVSIHYLLVPGGIRFDEYLVDEPAVAHNAYLQVLAETGVIGLSLFIAIIGACIWTGISAAKNFAKRGNRQGELLTRAVLIATAAILAGIFFLSEEHSKHLWLLLALLPALLNVSKNPSEE